MKVGDSFPPKQTRGKPCPKCKQEVFKNYPTGFVIETAQVVEQLSNGFRIRDDWHCPGCGHWEEKTRNVSPSGLEVSSHVSNIPDVDSSHVDSSDKPKKKKVSRE